jgi:hypothetical protein
VCCVSARGCWYVHCHRQRAYAWLRIDELHDIHYVLFSFQQGQADARW